jgi:hypothetical protein
MNETLGSHQKVPVPTGNFVSPHHAVFQAEFMLRVLEERLDALSHSVEANHVFGSCVDFVRSEVLDQVLFVCLFLR